MKKKIYWMTCFLMLAFFLTGCGSRGNKATSADAESKEETKSKDKLGDYKIQLGGEVIEQDGKFYY